MATTYLLLLFLSAFISLSCGIPAGQSVLANDGNDVKLTPTKVTYSPWDLPNVAEFRFGTREEGDFLIHTYRVNVFEYNPDTGNYRKTVEFPLPVGYRWTYTLITVGQFPIIDSAITVHSINDRTRFSFTYQSMCDCSVLAYDVVLYATQITN